MASIDSRDRATILIHFYRAMVSRADIWRMRMDTTTNWAIGTTAAVVSFALGDAELPHFTVLLASLLSFSFLMLEARRLTFYHLWQQRVLELESGMIRPVLHAPAEGGAIELDERLVDVLDRELGQTVPTMPIFKATARRLRRIYLYLFAAQWFAWILKLSTHPTHASSTGEIVERASIAGIPGALVVLGSFAGLGIAVIVAFGMGGIDRRRGGPSS